MKYERFEDVPVWQDSADLAADMFPWAGRPEFRALGDLTNQLQRAALSISNTIAEGFERGTTNELIAFLLLRARLCGGSSLDTGCDQSHA